MRLGRLGRYNEKIQNTSNRNKQRIENEREAIFEAIIVKIFPKVDERPELFL